MDNLLEKYCEITKKLLDIDIDRDFDMLDDLLNERQLILDEFIKENIKISSSREFLTKLKIYEDEFREKLQSKMNDIELQIEETKAEMKEKVEMQGKYKKIGSTYKTYEDSFLNTLK